MDTEITTKDLGDKVEITTVVVKDKTAIQAYIETLEQDLAFQRTQVVKLEQKIAEQEAML